jgi:hypothetical protein
VPAGVGRIGAGGGRAGCWVQGRSPDGWATRSTHYCIRDSDSLYEAAESADHTAVDKALLAESARRHGGLSNSPCNVNVTLPARVVLLIGGMNTHCLSCILKQARIYYYTHSYYFYICPLRR